MHFVENNTEQACLCCSKLNATANNLSGAERLSGSDELGVGVGLSQDDPVPEELEEGVVVAEEDQSQRYGLMPLLRADQGVELVEYHSAFQDHQDVQYP